MFSLGIEPSITSTNGSAASPRAAARNGVRNSSPPSVGESTLLWRLTFGIPGIAPSSTSSMPGWPAAVIETESPSQLIPSEIQRMWTSSTPGAKGSAVIRDLLLHVQGLHGQLLACDHLDVPRPAGPAGQGEGIEAADRRTRAAASFGGHDLERELGALDRGAGRDQLERELERLRHHLAQVPDGDLDPRDTPPAGVPRGDHHDRLGDRQLMH